MSSVQLLLLLSLFALLVAATAPVPHVPEASFAEFVQRYNKRYASDADRVKAEVTFHANVARLPYLRANGGGAKFGINEFADMTEAVRTSFLILCV